MQYKLLASDFDNTLVPFGEPCPRPAVVKAVKKMQAAGGKLVHVTAAFHAAPVYRTHQRFGGQVDGKLSAFLNEVVAVAFRPNADGYHAGLGADGAGPTDGDEVGLLQPAAGDQHRRFRVQQGAAPPALFAHP